MNDDDARALWHENRQLHRVLDSMPDPSQNPCEWCEDALEKMEARAVRAETALAELVSADEAYTEHQFHCDSSPCVVCDDHCDRFNEELFAAREVLSREVSS